MRDFFINEGWVPVSTGSYKLFCEYEQYTMLQEASPVMLVTWASESRALYKVLCGFLCSVSFYKGKPVSFTVHQNEESSGLSALADELYALCGRAGLPSLVIKFVELRRLAEFSTLQGYNIQSECNRNDAEYVYNNEDILNFIGSVNRNKRERLSKYLNDSHISFGPITPQNIENVLDVQKSWCIGKDCEACASFCGCEYKALAIMVEIFDESRHEGIYLYEDNVLAGFGLGERINKKLAFPYFGKSKNNNYFLYCMYKLSEDIFKGAEYVNYNEDMGNEGIRSFKRHLGPFTLWDKYTLTITKS